MLRRAATSRQHASRLPVLTFAQFGAHDRWQPNGHGAAASAVRELRARDAWLPLNPPAGHKATGKRLLSRVARLLSVVTLMDTLAAMNPFSRLAGT
eukprot:gene12505-biopygen3651